MSFFAFFVHIKKKKKDPDSSFTMAHPKSETVKSPLTTLGKKEGKKKED